jgi:hypothetical protein
MKNIIGSATESMEGVSDEEKVEQAFNILTTLVERAEESGLFDDATNQQILDEVSKVVFSPNVN